MRNRFCNGFPLLIGVLGVVFSLSVSAQQNKANNGTPLAVNPEARQAASVNLQDELMGCAAYYQLVLRAAIKDQGNGKDVKLFTSAWDNSFHVAYATGKAVGMTDKALSAEYKMHLTQLVQELHGTWTNLPALNDLGTRCKSIEEHPDQRLLYWIEYETKRHKKLPD